MTNLLKISAAAAALVLGATPAAAQQVNPDSQAKATARIVKPLSLYWVQDLDLGSIILGAGSWTGAQVSIDSDGNFLCTNANVTCTGNTTEAQYRVTGTNNQAVTINSDAVVTLTEPVSGDTLDLTVDNPGSINLGNSGVVGYTFGLGGAITVDSTTTDGTYEGTFNVTVEY